jgi:PIN domain nuclease of toxin-antitoxin system
LDARSHDEGDAGAHPSPPAATQDVEAATPQAAPRDFQLRRSRCDRQPRDFKEAPGGPAPVLTLSAAVREANACGRKLAATPASIFPRARWGISAIVLWELAKLAELERIEVDLDDPELDRFLVNVHVWPLTLEVVRALRRLDFRSDPADEIIAATSLIQNAPLLTRDRRLLKSKIVPLAR